jgi:hypothetical protein
MARPVRTGAGPARRSPALAAPRRALAGLLGVALAMIPAQARPGPSFAFEKRQDVNGIDWSGAIRAAACQSAGNTQSLGLSFEGTLARTTRGQRLLLAGAAAYARSRLLVPIEADGAPGIGPDELHEVSRTTKQSWSARARWDRFLSAHGSAYLLAGAAADEPAGKRLVLAAQAGYGIDVVHSERHGLRLELGYDFSREDRVAPGDRLDIHSARAFAGYSGRVLDPVTLELSLEALTNLNEEPDGSRLLRPFEDTRVLARAGARVKINGTLSTGVQLKAAWDSAPAPRPPPPGAKWADGYAPLAEKLDSTTELFVAAKF